MAARVFFRMTGSGAGKVGLLLATTAWTAVSAAQAFGQTASGPVVLPVVLAQASNAPVNAERDFNIPAQSLATALALFGQQSGLQITADGDLVRGVAANGVQGRMTSNQALQQMLTGTGLTYSIAGGTTITLQKAVLGAGPNTVQLGPISVTGQRAVPSQAMIDNLPPEYAGGQVARGSQLGLFGNRDVMDTPFNQTSYTAKMMQDQQTRSIADVAANDPSVRAQWPSTSFSAPLMIRGFPVSNQDVAYGGLYGVAPALTVGVEIAERVEILKGASALLTGMQPNGSVGGSVNLVPKRATDDPITQLTTSYISDSQLGAHLDFGRRFGPNKEYGVRFNGLYRNGDTVMDHQSQELGAAVAGLDYRGEKLRLALDLGYQRQYQDAPTVITFVNPGFSVPKAPKGTTNWYQPWSWIDIGDTFGALRGEFDIAPDWTAFAAVGGRDTQYERWSWFPTVINAAGDLRASPSRLELRYISNTEEAGVRGKVKTGPVDHQLTMSATRYYQDSYSQTVTNPAVITSNLYVPRTGVDPGTLDISPVKASDTNLSGVSVGDALSILDERVQLLLGLRQQEIKSRNYNALTRQVSSKYEQSKLTPTVGMVVKPLQNVSLYGNYIEGLQQGAIVGATYANAGQVLAPYVSKQYEAGVKVDWGSITTTIAAFQITQPSATTASGNILTAGGEQRNRGLELNVFGEVAEGVRLLGGGSLVDPILTKTTNHVDDGKNAIGVPKVQLNIGGEWDTPFVPNLTLTARAIHTGKQYMDTSNVRSIPAWNRFDLGARYKIETQGTPITIRANVENVFNTSYWASSSYAANWLTAGAPRTFLVSTTFDF